MTKGRKSLFSLRPGSLLEGSPSPSVLVEVVGDRSAGRVNDLEASRLLKGEAFGGLFQHYA